MPDGLNTLIGERGIKLSGGQRQRIGIARALYHDPGLIIMDEATSALDSLTEADIIKEINLISKQKTLIIIAHRMSTIQNCDVIHLIEDGKIICSDRYSNLIENCDSFRELVKINTENK
ncbi:MAG: ATP-binding cassette domain-containing protein [Okeania sp. SIO3B3]|nr:ATP-binding cassette domain-containing protein [Okeania sp. SIO3B3]